MPLITSNIETIDPFYLKETPEEGKDMHRFFMSVYALAGTMLLVTAAIYFLLLHSPAMAKHIFPHGENSNDYFQAKSILIFLSGLILIPLFHSLAFFRSSRLWLIGILVVYPFLISYYTALCSMIFQCDAFGGPLLSSGGCFIICAILGLTAEKFFYLKIIPYLKFFVGLCMMFGLHELMPSSATSWFVGVLIFWIFDFIASDSRKLYHIPKIKNPPLDNVQHLLIAVVSIIMIVGLWKKGGSYILLEGRLSQKDRMK